MELAKLSTPELVKLLEHPNNWMRRKARRVLIERNRADSAAPLLKELLQKPASPIACSEAALVLKELGLLSDSVLEPLAKSPDAGHRMIAARFSEGGAWSILAQDPDANVRLTLAANVRKVVARLLTKDSEHLPRKRRSVDAEWSILVKTAKDGRDQPLSFMLWQVWEPELVIAPDPSIKRWAELSVETEPLSHSLTHKSMRRLCDTRDSKNLDLCLDFLAKIKAHDVLLAHALDGLAKGQEGGVIKPTKDFAPLFAEFAKSDNADVRKHAKNLAMLWGDPAAIQGVAAELLDAKLPEQQRLAALASLRKVRTDEARKAFAAVVAQVSDLGGAALGLQKADRPKGDANEATSPNDSASGPRSLTWATTGNGTAFALEVIRAAADLGDDSFPKTIMTALKTLPDNLRLAAYATLTSRADWTHQLLDHLAAAKATTNFPVSLRRQLNNVEDMTIRKHANEVFGLWRESSDDLKALIAAKKKACLEGEPDLAQGKLLFTTTCAVCHTFFGGGQKVGPELIGSGRSNLDAILANVIDPNQIIGNGYENVIVSTKDNRTLMGRITEDTPSHVKLLAIGGAESVVPRDQIAKLENTHQSLMPMGFGGLPDDQFRNLIWYVLAPPDEGPLTADRKKALSTSIDAAPAKPKAKNWRAIDWESVSLWNPKWKITAPEFEGTPNRIAEYHGRKNLLVMHPFEDKKTPCALEQKLVVDAAHPKLRFGVASDDRGDWLVKVLVNGQEVKAVTVDHEKLRWKDVEVDLSAQAGKEVTVRLEGHATGWSWEFSYWSDVRWE